MHGSNKAMEGQPMQLLSIHVLQLRRGWQVVSSGDLRERFDCPRKAADFAERFAAALGRNGIAVEIHHGAGTAAAAA